MTLSAREIFHEGVPEAIAHPDTDAFHAWMLVEVLAGSLLVNDPVPYEGKDSS